ncbi:MAG TPA: dihydrofolate reductase [Candidatus Dormibacteraeota bacterium]|nr:dihydrofolate reductase [Candidatus Dormibacteraeota bacterium]
MIRFIAAIDIRRGLANENGIPWQGKLPTDVAYFRNKTTGGNLLMGYGWYQEQEHPLANRRNIVATTKDELLRDGFEKVKDAREYLRNSTQDVWVGGGAQLFETTIDLADELYLTKIETDFHCTKFFPPYETNFKLVSSRGPIAENGLQFSFCIYQRF